MSNKRFKNGREVEMSLQKQIIEDRKRQIEAKLSLQQMMPTDKQSPEHKSNQVVNVFSNDGSFLEQFKQKFSEVSEISKKSIESSGSISLNDSTISYPDLSEKNVSDSARSSNEATIKSLAKLVAERGDKIEDTISSQQNPNFWFLADKSSRMYQHFRNIVNEYREKKPEVYEPEELFEEDDKMERKRKRKSRWSNEKVDVIETLVEPPATATRTESQLIEKEACEREEVNADQFDFNNEDFKQYTLKTFGTSDLTEDQLKQAREHYKIHYLYQDILKKREGLDKLHKFFKKNIVDDDNEDITAETWEHKLRNQEMQLTKKWSAELNKNASGKHHIGDYLPPAEMEKLLQSISKSETKNEVPTQKLDDSNVGFKMLEKLGWKSGQGLGSKGDGIVEPVKSCPIKETKEGLGSATNSSETGSVDNENAQYDLYRKRMMLAYRFRPNPLQDMEKVRTRNLNYCKPFSEKKIIPKTSSPLVSFCLSATPNGQSLRLVPHSQIQSQAFTHGHHPHHQQQQQQQPTINLSTSTQTLPHLHTPSQSQLPAPQSQPQLQASSQTQLQARSQSQSPSSQTQPTFQTQSQSPLQPPFQYQYHSQLHAHSQPFQANSCYYPHHPVLLSTSMVFPYEQTLQHLQQPQSQQQQQQHHTYQHQSIPKKVLSDFDLHSTANKNCSNWSLNNTQSDTDYRYDKRPFTPKQRHFVNSSYHIKSRHGTAKRKGRGEPEETVERLFRRFMNNTTVLKAEQTPAALKTGSQWDRVSAGIWDSVLENQQTIEVYGKKIEIWSNLYKDFKKLFQRFGLFIVGSTMSGFCLMKSDIDMCLVIRNQSVDQRAEELEHLNVVKEYLDKITHIENIQLIPAKVPILRFRDSRYNLQVDLNCNNIVGMRNTHLLRSYGKLDWRVKPLVTIVKLWARAKNINDAKNMTLSSYSLTLMVLNFLQCGIEPAVLPSLQQCYPEKFNNENDVHDIDLFEFTINYPSQNTDSLGEILLKFLNYYANFDFRRFAISVRLGRLISIDEFNESDIVAWPLMFVEEPFNIINTAHSVYNYEKFAEIIKVFQQTYENLNDCRDVLSLFLPL